MSYSDTVPQSERDSVRFLVRDTASPFFFSNNEIDSQLLRETSTGQARQFFTAASLLENKLLGYLTLGEGISEKRVDDLAIRFGLGERGTAEEGLRRLVSQLRLEGSRRLQPKPFHFRVLKTTSRQGF